MSHTNSELESLAVYGESDVGWDEHTLPNETVDLDGNLNPEDRGFGKPDPRAPSSRRYDDPEVQALREHLKANNGIKGLEICAPDEVERAVRIFHRDGFVVVKDVLDPEKLDEFRSAAARVLKKFLRFPGQGGRKYLTESTRLPHRYSYSTTSATRHVLHEPVWVNALDLPTTTPILQGIFGTPDYLVINAGGEVSLPGAIEYQHLHPDLTKTAWLSDTRFDVAENKGIEIPTRDPAELDSDTLRLVLECTPPIVTVNFLMSDMTWENGPIRQIPGTHATLQKAPSPEDEPEWMRMSTLVGAPAGAAIIRDIRAWHGGTPNVSKEIRAMPSAEYAAPWLPKSWFQKAMPHEIYEGLGEYTQHLCRHVKAEPDGWAQKAGPHHPIANTRLAIMTADREEV